MKKRELEAEKHVLITRDENVYWYVGDKCEEELISLYTNTDDKLDRWTDNLLLNRDKRNSYEKPRNLDVILVYEIINFKDWLHFIRHYEYIDYETMLRSGRGCKLVYEMVDGVFN